MARASEEKIPNVYQRIHAVMQELDYIQKEEKKPGLQFRYASHDAVTAAVREKAVKHGLVIMPSVNTFNQDGNRTEVYMTTRIVNIDDPTDFVEINSFGYGIDPQDKGPGKAVSYAFKYALLKGFCLETGDDADAGQGPEFNYKSGPVATGGTIPVSQAPTESKEAQFKRLLAEAAKIDPTRGEDVLKTQMKAEGSTTIGAGITWLQSYIDKTRAAVSQA